MKSHKPEFGMDNYSNDIFEVNKLPFFQKKTSRNINELFMYYYILYGNIGCKLTKGMLV
jgi:hypothetical protein